MGAIDVRYGVTIACDPSGVVKAPIVSQDVLQQERIRTRWDAVDSVIGAHDTSDLRIADASLEWGQVIFGKILLGDHRVEAVAHDAFPVVQVVRGEVFAVCDNLEVRFGVESTLEAEDEIVNITLQMEGVFSWGFLTTTPARILECWKRNRCQS